MFDLFLRIKGLLFFLVGKVLSVMRSSDMQIQQSAQVNILYVNETVLLCFDFSRIKNVLHSAYV